MTLEYAPGGATHPAAAALHGRPVTVGPTAAQRRRAPRGSVHHLPDRRRRRRRSPTAGDRSASRVRARRGRSTITANTVARKTAAAALVLDRSGSMSEDRGDGQLEVPEPPGGRRAVRRRHASRTTRVGIVRYNEDAQVVQRPHRSWARRTRSTRRATRSRTSSPAARSRPAGATSIGDGIDDGPGHARRGAAGYDVKALVVLTDGKENQPKLHRRRGRARSTSGPTPSAWARRRTRASAALQTLAGQQRRLRAGHRQRSAATTASCCRSTSCRSWPGSPTPRSCSTRRASSRPGVGAPHPVPASPRPTRAST